MDLKQLLVQEKDYVIQLRREFHQHPEISWEEFHTQKRVKEELDKMGIPHIDIVGTGVLGTIQGKSNGKILILRADMDALSVQELAEHEYKSTVDGVSHACGHDGHLAMLLGAAKILSSIKDSFDGTIKLLFQPAEEVCEGIKQIIKEDVLGKADGCFGIHIWVDVPCGKISIEEGPRMASGDIGKIKVIGKGCHGSAPHQGVDACLVSSAIVMNLQSILSSELPQGETNVFTIGTIKAGERFNVIAPDAVMEFTIRSFNPETRKRIPEIIERIASNTAAAYRAKASIDSLFLGAAAVINDKDHTAIAVKSATKLFGSDVLIHFEKIAASEDFGILQENYPGVFVFVGGGNPEKACNYAHHNGNFNFDEDALYYGTGLATQYALDFLAEK